MLTWDLFRHYLFSRRAGALVRTVAWLCIFGVGVGVMALLVVLSIMNGFNDSLKNRLLAVEPHLVVKIPDVNDYAAVQGHAIFSELNSRPQFQARVLETQEILVRTADGVFGGGLARGVEPDGLRQILREIKKAAHKSKGAPPEQIISDQAMQTPLEVGGPEGPDDVMLGPGEVLIGVGLARQLGIFPGEKVTVIAPEALLLPVGEAPDFERVTIKGLLATNIADIDDKAIFYPRATTLLHLHDSASKEVAIEVRLPDPNNFSGIKAELEGKGAKVTTWIDRNSSLFYALKMEKVAMGSFLGLSALIASFSILTVLVLLLTQKRKDIGVLMAMGLSPARTRAVFVRLGLLLSGIGIGGGLLVGLTLCFILSTVELDILPSIYYETTIPAKVDARLVFGVIFVAGLVSGFSAYFPARKHTRLAPAEALRSRGGGDGEV